ncbi:MAG: glutamine--fructose-6-phosphate transaminase (isomerizing) [Ruminococcus sp.]|nr:glutamine--fructose-6-phosphate transaminase (isomerizing) [Ruminococcus sp.]MCM1382159.1 glutamine--fructose-6-phosphate transaminase (isomerizing) [Muribaculaceae bacterium]MCM1479162.1 glutamine--fructose-6-phosphate transaminase (isomerizing) [Muribaculaceae bacterium]
MCGIVGYVGKEACAGVLVDALKRLEYRGYDSAGIALFEGEKIKTVKAKGKIAEGLAERLKTEPRLNATCGIGHTRWATHGEPSDVNAHPIGNGRVCIVHNGIIENYRELKAFLTSKGYGFESETDTETVAKLLDYYYEGDPVEAIEKTVSALEGAYSLGIIFREHKNVIYAVRKDSPLIVGKGETESYIASDVTAILEHTREYYLLEKGEIAILDEKGVRFTDMNGEPIEKELLTATWDVAAAQKGGYEHFMLKEIHEQPEALRNTVSPRVKDGLPNLSECGLTAEKIRGYRQIFIVGCGSAMHSGMVGKYLIEDLARIPVVVDIASEFRYRNPLVTEGDLVVIISQSGETADTLEALKIAKRKGADTLAVVNVVGSSIAREADMVIYTNAGPEISVCSTKAYAVQVAFMYLFAFEVAYALGKIDENECRRLVAGLEKVPEKIGECLEDASPYQYVASKIFNASSLMYIGRGLDNALSMEGSLKLKEISYIHSEAYAAGELKHGTISLIEEGTPVIAVATQSALFEKTLSNVRTVKSRGAKVVMICKSSEELDSQCADFKIGLPAAEDMFLPLISVVAMQLIAYYTAVQRGCDVDKPRNLAKSVTVE